MICDECQPFCCKLFFYTPLVTSIVIIYARNLICHVPAISVQGQRRRSPAFFWTIPVRRGLQQQPVAVGLAAEVKDRDPGVGVLEDVQDIAGHGVLAQHELTLAARLSGGQRPLHLPRRFRRVARIARPVVAVVGEGEEEDGVVVIGSPHLLDQPITPQLIRCQERRVTRNEPLRLVQQVFDVSIPDAGGAVSAGSDDMFAIRAKGDRPV